MTVCKGGSIQKEQMCTKGVKIQVYLAVQYI